MANIKKSFNFRNGIQVDDDNFIINANGLVGIGSTIPTEVLDVFGNVRVRGTLITDNFQNTSSDGSVSFNRVTVGITSILSGIITASSVSGIITYYGDGSKLQGLPTSQWIDVDPSINGYLSIYSSGNVGVATTNPNFTFQVGANPLVHLSGIGINSTGDVYSAGIITAISFSGSGIGITSINASNILTGILSNSRLPSNISVSGIITSTSGFVGNLTGTASTATSLPNNISVNTSGIITATTFSGNLTGTASTATTLPNDISVNTSGIITATTFSGNLTGTASTATTLPNDININTSGIITATTFSGNLTGTASTATSLPNNISVNTSGIITATTFSGNLTGTASTATSLPNDISVNTSGIITATTFSGNLTGTASTATDLNGGSANITNLRITGVSTFVGNILPDNDASGSIGTVGGSFAEAYINSIQIGSSGTTIIDTRSGDLILDSNTDLVIVNGNLKIEGNAEFGGEIDFGNNVLTIDSINTRIGIGSTIPTKTLSVNGTAEILGRLDVTDECYISNSCYIGTVSEFTPNITALFDTTTSTTTLDNLVVLGTVSGISPQSSITISASYPTVQAGIVSIMFFNSDFSFTPIVTGITTVGLSSIIGLSTEFTLGIGTDIVDPNAKVFVSGNTTIDAGNLLVTNSVTSFDGYSSGIGTPVQIDGDITGGAYQFKSTGIGTVYIASSGVNDITVLEGLWFTSDFENYKNNKIYTPSTNVGVGTTIAEQLFQVGAGTSSFVVTGIGSVGIGTVNPEHKLTVHDGDISVGTNNSHGVILTSPNGSKYRLIVSNTGTLSTVLVT